jgi:Spy/CpxP family protein refolding chaperone
MNRVISSFALSFLIASALIAQKPVGPNTPKPAPQRGQPDQLGQPDPFGKWLFPPELVMQHQGELGLSDAQRATIQKDAIAAQSKFMEMQWKMSAEMEKLTTLLSATPIDEPQALEQLDRILSAERDVKKAQMGLLIQIKNTLTRDQQARLDKWRMPTPPPQKIDWTVPPPGVDSIVQR